MLELHLRPGLPNGRRARLRELCGHDLSSTEGREKLGLGLKAMRVLGISSPGGPAKEPGARRKRE